MSPGSIGSSGRLAQRMRPVRRFDRGAADPDDEVVTAIDRLRDALEPGELRQLLDRRREPESDDDDAA